MLSRLVVSMGLLTLLMGLAMTMATVAYADQYDVAQWDSSASTTDYSSDTVHITGNYTGSGTTGTVKINTALTGEVPLYPLGHLVVSDSGDTNHLLGNVFAEKVTVGSGTLSAAGGATWTYQLVLGGYKPTGGSGDADALVSSSGGTINVMSIVYYPWAADEAVTQNVAGIDYSGYGENSDLYLHGKEGAGGDTTFDLTGNMTAPGWIYLYSLGGTNKAIFNTNGYDVGGSSSFENTILVGDGNDHIAQVNVQDGSSISLSYGMYIEPGSELNITQSSETTTLDMGMYFENSGTTTVTGAPEINVGGDSFYNFGSFSADAAVITISDDGGLESSGTFDAGSSSITVGGDWGYLANSGEFDAGTSVITVADSFSNAGSFTAGSSSITVGGSFDTYQGTFDPGTGSVTIDNTKDDNPVYLDMGPVGAVNPFNDLTVNVTGGGTSHVFLYDPLVVNGDFHLEHGTFSAIDTVYESGSWDQTYNGGFTVDVGATYIADATLTAVSENIGGTFTQQGGTNTVGTLTLGAVGGTTTYNLNAGTLDVTGDLLAIDVGSSGRVNVNMGAGTTLSVGGNLALNSGTHEDGGCFSGYAPNTTVSMDDTAQLALTGSGSFDLGAYGGCHSASSAPVTNISAAAPDEKTTLINGLSAVRVTLGSGTLDGGGGMMIITGSGTGANKPFTSDPATTYLDVGSIVYRPIEDNAYIDVASNSFDGVAQFALGSNSDTDVHYVLSGDIGASVTDAPSAINIEGASGYTAYVDLAGNAIFAKQTIYIGGTSSYADIDIDDDESLTAGTGIGILGGSTLTMIGSAAMTMGTVTGMTGDIRVGQGGTLYVGGLLSAAGDTLTVANGGTLLGGGTLSGIISTVGASGIISPGNSPGELTINGGSLSLDSGSHYEWELFNGGGVAGEGWDLITLLNSAALIIDPLGGINLDIFGWTGTDRGAPSVFDPYSDYQWMIVDAAFGSISGFDENRFILNNNIGGATGSFSLGIDSGNLYLNYTGGSAVPEPATVVSMIMAAFLAFYRKVFKRKKA